jgi:hypothetical protein
MVYIYVFKSTVGKWLIGEKKNMDHPWMKTYRPFTLDKTIKQINTNIQQIVNTYMEKYGVENVRGGSYSNVELCIDDYEHINRYLWMKNGLCRECGYTKHNSDICTFHLKEIELKDIDVDNLYNNYEEEDEIKYEESLSSEEDIEDDNEENVFVED